MYQVKFTSGYEIHIIGKGEKGLCRVVNSIGFIVYESTYAACERWLNARTVRAV